MQLNIGTKGTQLNILLVQGADFGPYYATMTNPDGTPVDLTGCIIRGVISKAWDSPAPVANIQVDIIDPAAGKYQFWLDHTITKAIPAGASETVAESRYLWELVLEDSSGRIVPLYYGDASIFRGLDK